VARPERGAWGVTETSRLSTTADALARALEGLGDALAQADAAAIAASEALIETRSGAFRAAALQARTAGETLPPSSSEALSRALARCRLLGLSLNRLTGQPATTPDAPRGYTPVGRPVAQADGGTFLTARG
jgi:hypothetical protein